MRPIIYILLLTLCFSCEREIEFGSNSFERQPVVNAILSSDSTIVVNLTYSTYFTDSIFSPIQNASVKVIDLTDNQEYELVHRGDGNYQNKVSAISSHEYRLEIDEVGDELMYAQTCVPKDVELNLTIDTLYDELDLISELEIDVEIKNDPDQENFYTLEVFEYSRINSLEVEDDTVENVNIVPTAEELLTLTQAEELPSKTLTIFSDKDFEGEDVRTSLNIGRTDILFDNSGRGDQSQDDNRRDDDSTNNTEISSAPRYAIRIMAVSPELYNYIKSFEIYSQQDGIITSNSQPSVVEFNIMNGLGIFGGSNVQIIPIN